MCIGVFINQWLPHFLSLKKYMLVYQLYLLIFYLTLREAVKFKQYIYKGLSVSLIMNTVYPSPTTTHLMASIALLYINSQYEILLLNITF